MDFEESLDVSSRYLDDEWEVNASTNLIKRQIEQINKRLSEAEKETLIIEADTDNPPGTVFENHIKKSHFTNILFLFLIFELLLSNTYACFYSNF